MRTDSPNVSRQTLRHLERTRRAGISQAEYLDLSSNIVSHCVAWLRSQPLKPNARIALYWPIHGEPSILSLMNHPNCTDLLWALPKASKKGQPLQFLEYNAQDPLSVDAMGVATPALERVCQVEILFIPCLGFNTQRFRLGYGGGFYDRTLALPAFAKLPTVGIAYSASQFDEFLGNTHDIALGQIITERGPLV